MIILGLQFGHDATACVLRDGVIVGAAVKERHNRIRHAIGLDWSDVASLLAAVGIAPVQVDFCAVTSTQDVEYVFVDAETLSFELADQATAVPSAYYEWAKRASPGPFRLRGEHIMRDFAVAGEEHHYRRLFAQYRHVDLTTVAAFPSIEDFTYAPEWNTSRTLSDIAATDYSRLLDSGFATSFHLPITANLGGRRVPGALFSHHYAHAAYAFFASPFSSAAIISHDGGSARRGYRAGLFFWAEGQMLYPLTPHYLSLGSTYYIVAKTLGLGEVTGEGKLMGLSAYGDSRLLPDGFSGNWYDGPLVAEAKRPERLIASMVATAEDGGYDVAPFGDVAHAVAPINADIAAGTQLLFEETMLRAVDCLHNALLSSGISGTNLCLGGGAALNCPTNSRISAETPFTAVSVQPACDDSGLAMGSAYALYHCVLRRPRPRVNADTHMDVAYLGETIAAASVLEAVEASATPLDVCATPDVAAEAADMLDRGAVIGLVQGRSEVGPRALGNRSILASPVPPENWRRVNDIKGREMWRPLAPAVLEEHAADWFGGAPHPSPYMLFNAQVLSDRLPAITHVDGSARIQTVSSANGVFHDVLSAFYERTGIPVLLNTSLNGPGEPIVATAQDAVRFLSRSRIDALFVGNTKVTRR